MTDNSESPLGDVLASVIDYLEVLDRSHADLCRKLANAGGDAQLGQKLEAIIAMRTGFTGEPPYVGNEGVALALTQAFDERDRLRDALEDLILGIDMGWDLDGMIEAARAALPETEYDG